MSVNPARRSISPPFVSFFLTIAVSLPFGVSAFAADQPAKLTFHQGDRVVYVGGVFAERTDHFGRLETLIQLRKPDLGLTFRSLAWPGDTPSEQPRPLNFGDQIRHLTEQKADVIFLCFGLSESFAGPEGWDDFRSGLETLIKDYQSHRFNGKTAPRLVVVSPIAHENVGGDFPDPTAHNRNLKIYTDAMRSIAQAHNLPFVDLYHPTLALMNEPGGSKLTFNGVHLTDYGDWAVSQLTADQLFEPAVAIEATLDGSNPNAIDFGPLKNALARSLPVLPVPGKSHAHESLLKRFPKIVVKNLPGGEFTLVLDGIPIAYAASEAWSAGIRLSRGPLVDSAEKLRVAIADRNQEFYYRWRAVNGEYIYGRRVEPFGSVSFPPEMKKLDEMIAERDTRILALNKPAATGEFALRAGYVPEAKIANVSATGPKAESVYEIYGQKPGYIGGKRFPTAADPAEELKTFKVPEDFEVNLYASDVEFPLHKPIAMKFDAKGRMWVTCAPSYPQYLPGHPPDDKVLILDDQNGDGKADKCTVFADKLYLPGGIELGDGGAYIAEQPNLLFAKDTNGDDIADYRETILHGFGTGDSHHAINAFTWGPGGSLYMMEGTFLVSAIETPHGLTRLHESGVYRFQPKSGKIDVSVSYSFANPWGEVFDRWGQNFLADASGGSNYFALPIMGRVEHPRKHPGMKEFTLTKVRPTCGCEIVSSRNFPEDMQGNYLVNNCIGFQGIKNYKVEEDGSGFVGREVEPLLFSTDPNFRPVDLSFGPDGALYLVDWYNPLIGHMQFSIRDPGRDHVHGRIWRIAYKKRPLVKRPKIAGEPIAALLDLLRTYEDRTRYWARIELRNRDRAEVLKALREWVAALDRSAPDYEHLLLEALWIYAGENTVNRDLLNKLLAARDDHARAAATRVLRYWSDRIEDSLTLLRKQAVDDNPRVRLEAVVALSDFKTSEAADAALEALRKPVDYYLDFGLKETMTTLERFWRPALAAGKPIAAGNPAGAVFLTGILNPAELIKLPPSSTIDLAILSREGVAAEERAIALKRLTERNKSTVIVELLKVIEHVDSDDTLHTGHVLNDLAEILTARPADELRAARRELERIAARGKHPFTRQIATVALIEADDSLEPSWRNATRSLAALTTWVDAVPLIRKAELRAAAFDKIHPLVNDKLPETLASQGKKDRVPRGRFVRIELPGNARTLTLAEVEVRSDGKNIAPQGVASQSSVAYDGPPERAIDGNTDGSYGAGGQTHTQENEPNPWWMLDLGSDRPIEEIVVWNRTDGDLGDRLRGFRLIVRDSSGSIVYRKDNLPTPRPSVRFEIGSDPEGMLRRSAINALPSLAGRENESFRTLARLIVKGTDRDAAIRAIRRIPREHRPIDEVRPVLAALVSYVSGLGDAARAEPAALDAIQLGGDLASTLPATEAKSYRSKLGDLGVNVVLIRTIPHKMVYDRSKFYVEAGKPVVIVFENPDIMPHNWIVAAPGSLAQIGLAAERMASNPEGYARSFIPSDRRVLHSIRLVQPGESLRLNFRAPATVGEYPYVCTFPGHWRIMNGVMHVVPRLADIPADELNPPPASESSPDSRPFVRQWVFEDLAADLHHVGHGRSYERGKALFTAATCVQCHKARGEGGEIGPNLDEIARKVADKKITPADVLHSVLEPSKDIEEKYRPVLIETNDGEVATGIVLEKTADSLTIVAGPRAKPRTIKLKDVAEKAESKVSLMPQGLLVTLSKDEIFDLIAYVIAAGNPEDKAFHK
jgi:putative heme-binding domain-containing protein